jgi:hypothetical protein
VLGTVDETVSVTVQDAPPASEPPERLRLRELKVAVPPQVVAGPAPLRLVGSADAATATPDSTVDPLVLVIVNVSVEVPDVAIDVGLKAAAMLGAVVPLATVKPVGVVAVVPVVLGDDEDTTPVV